MVTPSSLPRRSPRGHAGSYPQQSHRDNPITSTINRSLFTEAPNIDHDDESRLSFDLDQGAFEDNDVNTKIIRNDRYPNPLPKLFSSPDHSAGLAADDPLDIPAPHAPSAPVTAHMREKTPVEMELRSTVVDARKAPSPVKESTEPPLENASTGQSRMQSHAASVHTSAESENERDLRRLYVHLLNMKVAEQKLVASAFNVVQHGNKETRGERLFVVISGIMERKKKTAAELLEVKGLEHGKDFKARFDRTLQLWGAKEERKVVPPLKELEKKTGVQKHPRPKKTIDDASDEDDETVGNAPVADRLSLEEFARLMLIFRDVPEAAEDLRRSGQSLRREELDISVNRHAFWTERIEKIFNDRTFITNEQLEGPLRHVDPGRPVSTSRTGSTLQDLFNKFRKEFTTVYRQWDVSGNMEADSFINFCRYPRSTTLTRSGARCLIAFQVFKIGTSAANTLILDFCSKEMAGASGAQLESGIGPTGESAVTSRKERKRLRSSVEVNDMLVDAIQSFSKRDDGDEDDDILGKKQRMEIGTLDIEQKRHENERLLIGNLLEAEKQISSRREVEQGDKVGQLLHQYYNNLVTEFEETVKRKAQR